MDSARILIAINNNVLVAKLKTILMEDGFIVIDQAVDGPDCLRKIRTLRPDILILEYNLPIMNGLEVSKVALEDKICEVVLLASLEQGNLLEDIREEAGFVSLVKPVSKMLLTRTLEIMLKNSRRIKQLEKEIEELRSNLNTRKEVEKAKGLLMVKLGLSEHDAFKRIQKQSMDRGISMKEIAKAIILAYDI